jgi:NADH:ubiquinone oxidoreductase subunit 6 (subunit J)
MLDLIFFAFSVGAIFTAFLVISKNNPVHSVFFLVLTFGNTSALLLLLGVEFLAIIFWIVYVGAIAILFIFVIKLINIKVVELLDNSTRYLPVGFIIGLILLFEIYVYIDSYSGRGLITENSLELNNLNFLYTNIFNSTNIELLGLVLYTDYWLNLIIASLILLVAMVGAILLTLSHESQIKRQDIFTQINKKYTLTLAA